MSRCDVIRHSLGAYVLGGLEAEETHALESHLRSCVACRTEHSEIAGLPDLLRLAQDAPPQVPGQIRDRVVAAAARQQLRHRSRRLATAVAVVAAAAGGLVGWHLAPGAAPVAVAVPVEDVAPFEVSGEVTFRPRTDTVEVRLELEGLDPLDSPSVYEVWLSTTDRRVVSIGQLPDVSGAVTVEVTAPGSLDDYRSFWLTAEPDGRDPAHDGPTVVRGAVPDLR